MQQQQNIYICFFAESILQVGQRFRSILIELHGRSLAGLQCQLVHLQIDLLQSSLSVCTCLTVCLMWSFFLLLLSLSVYQSLLTYGGRPGIVLTYLQLCSSPPSPDSLLFPVPIRMRHSCKLYTLNLTDIFRPALIFHSVQSRHLLGTLRFLILISDLAYETIALFQCK